MMLRGTTVAGRFAPLVDVAFGATFDQGPLAGHAGDRRAAEVDLADIEREIGVAVRVGDRDGPAWPGDPG